MVISLWFHSCDCKQWLVQCIQKSQLVQGELPLVSCLAWAFMGQLPLLLVQVLDPGWAPALGLVGCLVFGLFEQGYNLQPL